MLEHSAQWTIVGDDGTTVQFNDGASGWLLEEVTGFDSPDVRQNLEELPEEDGAVAGDFFFGARPVTFRGRIAAPTAAQRNASALTLMRALRGLRGDVTVKSQASGLAAMQAKARLQNFRLAGGYVKTFLIGLVCPDPRFYSQAENSQAGSGGGLGIPGAVFPWAFPVNFGGGSGAALQVTVTNAGNFDSPPVIRVAGPCTNPQVELDAPDESLYVDNLILLAGEWIDIDMNARTVKKNDGSSFYDRVRFPGSVWWRLRPGSNTVKLWASGTDATTALTVTWRDAWA